MPDTRRDLARTMFQILVVGGLFAGCFWVLRPFLLPTIWAATIVVATWPVMLWVEARLGGRRALAVAAMTLSLLLLLLLPLTLAVAAIVQNADRIVAGARSLAATGLPAPPGWLERLPLVGGGLADQWRLAVADPEGLSARLAPYASGLATWLLTQAGSLGKLLAQFLLTVIIAALLYAGGEGAAAESLRFARRLSGSYGERTALLAAQAIRAVALGVVVTALVQSALGGIGLAVAGVPYPVPLTVVMFVLGVAQVGVGPVLLPAVAWLYWTGGSGWGTFLLVWTIPVFFLDNFLRPMLIRRGADLPLLLVFAGVLGGLLAFGVIGLFIGPVLLAVGHTLLEAWIASGESGSPPAQ